jgi:hypothetical protein
MPRPLKLLCLHGVGHQEADPTVQPAWREAVLAGLRAVNPAVEAEFAFLEYDAHFAAAPRDFRVWRTAFRRLLDGALRAAAEKAAGAPASRTAPGAARGFSNWFEAGREQLQWTAGMVAQWAADDLLRARVRRVLADALGEFAPDAILAHSLGSLIAYDLLARPKTAALGAGRVLVTLGSQVNNPFVRDLLGGRLRGLETRQWFHLHNEHDQAFTSPIEAVLPHFSQVRTPFDLPGFLDHDATAYLSHVRTRQVAWTFLANGLEAPAVRAAELAPGARPRSVRARAAAEPEPRDLREAIAFSIGEARAKPGHRALLVGINDYPDVRMQLEGCVNDVYLMSEVLQEHRFDAANIRIVLNDRATAEALRERLRWLLEDCGDDGCLRLFYYSGHGAQISSYGYGESVDGLDECLVPWDFDWSLPRSVTDDWFHELYCQLPPTARFLTVLDCCHSGGMARDGQARVRGLTAPDDLRHRVLRWEPDARRAGDGLWRPREELEDAAAARSLAPLRRLGRGRPAPGPAAQPGRRGSLAVAPAEFGLPLGAYQPILLHACQEHEKAYEYRHGSTPYGAFTWSLARALRKRAGKHCLWDQLKADVTGTLTELKYTQTPKFEVPPGFAAAPIPWPKTVA